MRIIILGSKGIPARYGGFETFAERIAKEFEVKGHSVLIIGDNSSETHQYSEKIRNYSINYQKSKNPLRFWHESIKHASRERSDIILHCGVAGIFSHLFFPSLNNKTYINPDGLGFKRSKYGLAKKGFLLLQFVVCSIYAKNIIADSVGIQSFFNKYLLRKRRVFVAEYGADILNKSEEKNRIVKAYFQKLKIDISLGYLLVIARLEPENNLEEIISGYLNSMSSLPLIIIGPKDTPFYKNKLFKYSSMNNIHFIGGVYDKILLQSIRLYCHTFIHGHTVGGTNPSLVEAIGSGNLIIAHDNVFNREILKDFGKYFKNSKDLSSTINMVSALDNHNPKNMKSLIDLHYSWTIIANKYLNILTKNGKET